MSEATTSPPPPSASVIKRGMAASAAVALAFCAWFYHSTETMPIELDEWSAVLSADTFANFRLANPAHPLGKHFERAGVLLEPSYVSEHPPLPGMALAVGQWLGEPLIGAALVFALAAATLFWMYVGWGFSAILAFVGALFISAHPLIVSSWGIGYLSGGSGLLGGALVYGALPRLRGAPFASPGNPAASRGGWVLGAGAVVLMLAGPFLALVACLPAAFVLGRDLLRSDAASAPGLATQLRTAAAFVAAGLVFLGIFDYRATGDPFTTPREAYVARYATAPDLLWQDAPAERPEYTNPSLPSLHREGGRMNAPYHARTKLWGFFGGIEKKLEVYGGFLFPWPLLILLAPLFLLRKDPAVRFVLASFVCFSAALSLQTFEFPQFIAPFVALGSVAVLAGLRFISNLTISGFQFGVGILPLILLPAWGMQHAVVEARSDAMVGEPLFDRAMLTALVERFEKQDHLVLVRYGNRHMARWEWLINEADIENAHVVYALELDDDSNRKLLDHFSDREPWRLTSANNEVSVVPFSEAKEWRTAAASPDDS